MCSKVVSSISLATTFLSGSAILDWIAEIWYENGGPRSSIFLEDRNPYIYPRNFLFVTTAIN